MELHKKHGISIFVRILIVFLTVNIATSGILIMIAFAFSQTSIEKRAKENITQQIESIRDNFENEYRVNLKRSLQALSSSSTLSDYIGVSEVEKLVIGKKMEQVFLQTMRTYKTYHSIRFVDAYGNISISVVGNLRRKEAVNLLQIEIDQEHSLPPPLEASVRLFKLLESIPLMLSAGYMEWFMPPRELQLEGPFLDENGTYAFLAGLSKLDFDIGDFGGVVMIHQKLDDFLNGLREIQFFDENPIWVFDAKGQVLQQPANDKISFDPSPYLPNTFQGASQLIDVEEGIVAYQDFSIIPGQPFIRVVISIPASLLLKDFANAIQFFSLVLVSSVVLVLFVALYVSRYLSKPIIELAEAASRLAHGDLSAKVQVETTGEVHLLVNSFNQMTEDLRQTIKSRDASVDSLVKEVTERKRAEHQLMRAKEQAELASRSKSQFLANMSHEIRSPLNSIVGFSQILLAHLEHFPQKFKQYLENIQTSGENLSELINNILDLSKIESGKMEVFSEPINLKLLVQGIYHINKAQAVQEGVKFSYDFDPNLPEIISSDRTKLNQILMNLVGNAIKFTPKDKAVQLKALREENFILLQVIDQGIGISKDRQTHIFEAFEQVDGSITRQFGGTGLGLAITKQMVELLKGEVVLESTPETDQHPGGSVFSVRLPLIASVEKIMDQKEFNLQNLHFLKDNRILVVEDNLLNQEVMKAFFQNLGLEIVLAGNGEEGIKKTLELQTKSSSPDIVFMDMHMPGMDGMTATKKILSHPECKDIPIIALSADAFVEQQEEAYAAGVSGYLTKPLDFQKLGPILMKYLRKEPENFLKGKISPLPPLPEIVENQLLEEFEVLSKIDFFDGAEIIDKTAKMISMCEDFDSSFPEILKKIEETVFASNEEQFYFLISEVLDDKHPHSG